MRFPKSLVFVALLSLAFLLLIKLACHDRNRDSHETLVESKNIETTAPERTNMMMPKANSESYMPIITS